MLPFKLIYHELYDLNLGAHVFPSQKYRLVADKLVEDGIALPDNFLRPEPAADADILRVHTPDWVNKLKTGTLTQNDMMILEVPVLAGTRQCLLAGGRRHDPCRAGRLARWFRLQHRRRLPSRLSRSWRRLLRHP